METVAYVPAVQGSAQSPGPRRRPWLVACAIAVVMLGSLALFFLLSRTGYLNRNNAVPGEAELAELKQVVAEHNEAAGKLLQTNQADEALARLGQALAAIDRARVSEGERNGLRLGIYRQRAQVLRGLGREAEAQDDARKARPLLEEQYAAQPDNVELAGALAEFLWAEPGAPWTVLRPTEMHSAGGATLTLQPDGSVLASGTNSDNDVYTVTLHELPASVWALRLELLADPSLPSKGPGATPAAIFSSPKLTSAGGRQEPSRQSPSPGAPPAIPGPESASSMRSTATRKRSGTSGAVPARTTGPCSSSRSRSVSAPAISSSSVWNKRLGSPGPTSAASVCPSAATRQRWRLSP